MEENIFNQIASKYDTESRQNLAKKVVEAIKPEIRDSKDKSLLDYGCGTGLVGLELCSFVDNVLLVDSSEQMIEVVREKIKKANIKNAQAVYSDFVETNLEIKADIIIASLVLLHIPDTVKILKQFYSILNEGGKLIIVDFDKNEKAIHPKVHNGFSHSEIESFLTNVGFKEIKINTFYHGKNIFMNFDASMFISTCVK